MLASWFAWKRINNVVCSIPITSKPKLWSKNYANNITNQFNAATPKHAQAPSVDHLKFWFFFLVFFSGWKLLLLRFFSFNRNTIKQMSSRVWTNLSAAISKCIGSLLCEQMTSTHRYLLACWLALMQECPEGREIKSKIVGRVNKECQ